MRVKSTPAKRQRGGAGRLLPVRSDGFLLGQVGVGGHRCRLPVGRLQRLDRREQVGIIRRDLGFQGVEQSERGGQVEEMLGAPGASEIPGDLGGGLPTARVPVLGQPGRIAFAPDDGAHDRQPGGPGEVGDRAMHLHVHLIQGLLHPLDAARALGHQIGQLALERAQSGDGLARTERAPQQPTAVQQLEPLTVADVGLPPRDIVQLAGVDEQGLDAPRLEQLSDGDPVDGRALHGHRLHAVVG